MTAEQQRIITENLQTRARRDWPQPRSRALTDDEKAQQKQLRRAAAYHFRAHASRIAPHAEIFVRTLSDAPISKKITEGWADYSNREIVLTSSVLEPSTETTLFHELWHIISKHNLTEEQREIVYDEVQSGERWHTDYLDKSEERAARAFAAYASARAHGLKLSRARPGTTHAIFEAVFNGELDELKQQKETEYRPIIARPALIVGLIALLGGLIALIV